MEKKEYKFLTQKPKIFLVGDPNKLGYKKESSDWNAQEIDSSGVSWWTTTILMAQVIFTAKHGPYGLRPEWFNNTFYYTESPKQKIRFDQQGWNEIWELLKKATGNLVDNKLIYDQEAIKALFEYSPPVTDYAVPEEGTDARKMFSAYAKLWSKDRESAGQIRDQLKKLTEEIR